MVTVWCCAAGLIHHSFLNPAETLASERYAQQIGEMHRKLQRLRPALGSGKGPILLTTTQPALRKLHGLGYEVLPHPPRSPDLLPTDYRFLEQLDSFVQGKRLRNPQDAENAFREFIESQSADFYA